jgi:ketosteroid isomerase-like protein
MTEKTIEQEVVEVLEAYADAVLRRDRAATLAMFTDDAVVIGTGVDEWYRGRADLVRGLDRDLEQATVLRLTYGTPEVGQQGDAAWVAFPTTVTAQVGNSEIAIVGRATAVLVRRGGRWLIAQNHLSVPAADQATGQSYPDAH